MTATLPGDGRPSVQLAGSLQLPLAAFAQCVASNAGLSATTRLILMDEDSPFPAAARSWRRCSPAASWSGLNSSSIEATPFVGVLMNERDFTDVKIGGRFVG